MSGIFGRTVAGFMIVLATSTAQAAEWAYTPQGGAGVEYVHNPQLVPSSASSYAASTGDANATLSADIAKHGDGLDLTIDPSLFFSRFLDHSLFDHDDQFLNVAGAYKTERITWSAIANGARDTTLTSEAGVTGLTNSNGRHEGLTLSAGPTVQLTERLSLSAQGGWQANHYADSGQTGLIDYRYTTGDLRGIYALTERTQVSLDASVAQLSTAQLSDKPITYAAVGNLTTQLDEKWTATLAAGPSFVESDSGNENGVNYEADLQRHGELLTLTAKVSRSVTPTGRGVLTRYDQILLNAARPLSERLTMNLSGQFSRNRDLAENPLLQSSAFTVNYYSLQGNLQWKFAMNWGLSLSAQEQHQSVGASTAPGSSGNSYRFGLGIVWNGNPRRLM